MNRVAAWDWSRIIAGFALLIAAATLSLEYRHLSRWSGSYLLASSATGAPDRELRLLAATVPALTYVRSESDLAIAIGHGRAPMTCLYDPSGRVVAKGLSSVESAASRIAAVRDAPALRVYSFALILGCLLGLTLSGVLQRRPEIPLLIAACVAVAKARMVCSTCLPSAVLGGLDAAWIGAGVYTLAALGCLSFPSRSRQFALTAGSGALAWQTAMLMSDVPDCAMCQSIMALNAALLASIVVSGRTEENRPAPWRRFAWLGCVAVPALVISQPMADRVHETAIGPKLDYTGKPIDVLLPKIKVPKDGLLVMFGKPTCAPCVDAHAALDRGSPVPFLPVEVVGRGEASQWHGLTIPYDTSRIDATPLFLIVRGDRRIVGMHRGWSGDAGWLVQFARIVADDLRPTESGSRK